MDRALTRLARLTLAGFHREVEVLGRHRLPPTGTPTLVVANHRYGFVDAVVVVHVLGRVPRFVAKVGLFRVRPLGWVLRRLGVLPVTRRQDRAPERDNVSTFQSVEQALAAGETVVVFPEGTAHDEPGLLPLRTGVARMALGARARGARGLVAVPVGITFEDKLALRSRVLAMAGEPLDVDDWVATSGRPGSVDDTNREAVAALTAELAARLGALTPGFASRTEAEVLTRAARMALRSPDPEAERRLVEVTALAMRLAAAPEPERDAVLAAFARYRLALDLVGVRDDELVAEASPGRLAAASVAATARLVGVAPFAVVGVAANALPYLAVRFAGRLARKPAEQGTMRVLAALVAFPAAWATAGWLVGRRKGALAGGAVAVAAGVGGWATVVEAERLAGLRRVWRGSEKRVALRGRVDELLAARAELLAAVGAAAAASPWVAPGTAAGSC